MSTRELSTFFERTFRVAPLADHQNPTKQPPRRARHGDMRLMAQAPRCAILAASPGFRLTAGGKCRVQSEATRSLSQVQHAPHSRYGRLSEEARHASTPDVPGRRDRAQCRLDNRPAADPLRRAKSQSKRKALRSPG